MDLNLKCIVCNKDLYPNQHNHYLVHSPGHTDRLVHSCCGKKERPFFWDGAQFAFYAIHPKKNELIYSIEDGSFDVDPDYVVIEDVSIENTRNAFSELPFE